jgi:hypothetical protein
MAVSIRSVVVSVSAGSPTANLLQLAADVARLIGADLRALYVEDESLLDVADLPLARELDPLQPEPQRWRPLAREQLTRDFELAAAALRRRLADVASSVGVQWQFFVVRAGAPPPSALDELREQRDVVLVLPAERKAQPLTALPAGAVLYAPSGPPRRRGDVIALARETEAPAARLADWIARSAQARLIVIDAAGHAEQLQHALGRLHERLIVARAGAFADGNDAARLAALRRVPVIVVPEDAGA